MFYELVNQLLMAGFLQVACSFAESQRTLFSNTAVLVECASRVERFFLRKGYGTSFRQSAC